MTQPPESSRTQCPQVRTQGGQIPTGVMLQQPGQRGPIISIVNQENGVLVGVHSELRPSFGCVGRKYHRHGMQLYLRMLYLVLVLGYIADGWVRLRIGPSRCMRDRLCARFNWINLGVYC